MSRYTYKILSRHELKKENEILQVKMQAHDCHFADIDVFYLRLQTER